ncbi:MAG TPA: ATP-binding protein [Burkholderiaceae bacterium]|nr:ATP-binding protein [Burkholderiaceae bacterium]
MKPAHAAQAPPAEASHVPAGPARRRWWLISALFAVAITSLLLLAVFCMDVLSSARAYVGGESLWSKSQKDGVRYLLRYTASHEERDWRGYEDALAIPLGDRVAREELEKPQPDLEAVRRGFIDGGNHPDDIPGMIRLFRWFRHIEFLDRAIAIWAEGDRLVAEMKDAAEKLHALAMDGSDAALSDALTAKIEAIDQRLTPLEVRFSNTLGEASRKTQQLLVIAVTAASVLLIGLAAAFVSRVAQHAARYERALRDANERLEQRVADRTHELTEANARLVQLDRLKSEFLATMSHELRTPLNAILGFSDLLLQERSGPLNAEQKRQLAFVEVSGRHLLEMIEDVLDLSRIEAGRMDLQAQSFDFAQLLTQLEASLRPTAQAKGLAFVCEAEPAELPVHADRRKCSRVLRSLANNAVKFTERGEIRVSACFDGGDLLVTVSDTGIGIAEQELPLIFQAFRQVDGSLRRAHGGIGVGLYLSRKLLDMMGGQIEVDSKPGVGSRFSVRLPR